MKFYKCVETICSHKEVTFYNRFLRQKHIAIAQCFPVYHAACVQAFMKHRHQSFEALAYKINSQRNSTMDGIHDFRAGLAVLSRFGPVWKVGYIKNKRHLTIISTFIQN